MQDTTKNSTKRRTVLQNIAATSGIGFTGLAGCLSSDGDEQTTTINLAYSAQEGSPHDEGAKLLSDTVEEETDGDIEFNLNCCQTAGGPAEIAESVNTRTLDMGISAVNNLAGLTNAWLFTQLPYLWSEHEALFEFFNNADIMTDVNEMAYEDLDNIEIKSYWGSNGGSLRHLHFTNDSTPTVPSDAAGEQIRVTESPIEQTTVNEWGFNATSIAWEETMPAIQQGVVDGIHLHYGWFYDDGVYEETNYTVETFTQDSPAVVYINRDSWDSLSSDHQEIIDETINEVTQEQIEIDLAHGEERKERSQEERPELTIHETTDDELNEWMQVVEPVYTQWLGEEGVSEEVVKAALNFQDYTPPGIEL